jgi:hypothetical protein
MQSGQRLKQAEIEDSKTKKKYQNFNEGKG